MSDKRKTFQTLAASFDDVDLVEAWLMVPSDDCLSDFDQAVVSEMARRYMAMEAVRMPTPAHVPAYASRPRLYAAW